MITEVFGGTETRRNFLYGVWQWRVTSCGEEQRINDRFI